MCIRDRVFTGSSNFSPSGEEGNGDHLILIEDRRIATAFTIEATRVFDHLQFRNRMRRAFGPRDAELRRARTPKAITLKRPTIFSGEPAWFQRFFAGDTQAFRDRKLFST